MSSKANPIDYQENSELLQLHSGNLALWRLSRRYFAIISGAIFAAVINKPELPKTVQIRGFDLRDVIMFYLTVGVFGLFLAETGKAIQVLTKSRWDFPEFAKRAFVVYTMVGMVILAKLLSVMMK